ncbi:MAG: hypothetical protein ACSHX8_03770 [Opitutaceae bacterium]
MDKVFNILGYKVRKRTVWIFFGGALLLLCAGVAIYLSLAYYVRSNPVDRSVFYELPVDPDAAKPKSKTPIREDSVVEDDEPVEELPLQVLMPQSKNPLKTLLDRHISVTGAAGFKTLRAFGEYRLGEVNFSIIAMSRAPNLYKQMMEAYGAEVEVGCENDRIWANETIPIYLKSDDETMKLADRMVFYLELSIMALGWLDTDDWIEGRYQFMGDEEWDGRQVYVIKFKGAEVPVFHYLDAETARELRRTATVVGVDGAEYNLEVVYLPPSEKSGFLLPDGYVCRQNGEIINEAIFTKFEFDKWLPSLLFEDPE